MDTISTGLIAAIGGAGVLAAMAFRQLTDTVIKLNQELRLAIDERRASETERATLKQRIDAMDDTIRDLEARIEHQAAEIAHLVQQLSDREAQLAALQNTAL